jgi:excisionase family DNA binding protein
MDEKNGETVRGGFGETGRSPRGGTKLTVAECAKRAGVSESLVYAWLRDRLLVFYRFGRPGKRGKILVAQADLDAFLESCRVDGHTADDDGELTFLN